MLEILDLELTLSKQDYKTQMNELMGQLRSLQNACWQHKLPVAVVLEGWAAAGKGALVKKMTRHMDPRGFSVLPIFEPSEREKRYPFLWRFWHKLPARGRVAFFYHSWYTHLLEDRLFERLEPSDVPTVVREINGFERHLVEDGMAIAKFWIHLSEDELKKRLKKAAKDELDAWRVRPEDWQQAENYQTYSQLAEEMLIQTSTGADPWILVEGDDKRWARVKVLSQLVATITEALDRRRIALPTEVRLEPQQRLLATEPDFLAKVDLSLKLEPDEYKERLRAAQLKLRQLQQQIYRQQLPVLLMFEGWDAAGKGGAIKRLTEVLDPRSYKVDAFAAPTAEENQYHYLWRFSRRLPGKGTIGIFDRSWYGRVLVERVENLATEREWRRAYREINEFEAQLIHADYVIVKFWLHVDQQEQLARFEQRKNDPYKKYKLTEEDWRNREKWGLYDVAINQAIARTSTPAAPWTVVPANDKLYARVFVIETVIEAVQYKLAQLKKQAKQKKKRLKS
ncbi:polyphosphate:AMP phosphotransferase [[Limnothrix rosea] IAM M-220]|uniref:polyphosphate:AMP phosphotransferase n=1 Tax=[Limnothrix rosea] IAM M-220 TaxID=454133 RepID=UPI00095D77BC|nr:polyphosphate:AMP phosphotransferase [[Limnothrix rosea] IAM M-220]OKH12343.1 polyphosphate:AMP phosphotransferase [[Limnothrix rosea] IAM M-220]